MLPCRDQVALNKFLEQGSHGHGKSWKKLLSWKFMEKSWNMKISQKVMEKSWNCFFSWLWQLSSLWLSCMLWDTIITISETMWEWESWKKANQSWKSHGILFSDFCGNPVEDPFAWHSLLRYSVMRLHEVIRRVLCRENWKMEGRQFHPTVFYVCVLLAQNLNPQHIRGVQTKQQLAALCCSLAQNLWHFPRYYGSGKAE